MQQERRVLILGAGGRDFHVFNTCFREGSADRVIAFTAAQIPHIGDRGYPPVLAGERYPEGIPIYPEEQLEELIESERIDLAVFAYSDVTLAAVESMRQRVEAAGVSFETFDPERTLLESEKPCVAVCAVRTGCGKSAVSRHVARVLGGLGYRVGVLRHPMPYGQLDRQVVQRFASIDDLELQDCTIEEMEEYEPHLAAGSRVYAGADYQKILDLAESESDVILWDGGNNDTPFVRPDLFITLLDPLRPGDELRYFPSRYNLERADVLIVAKSDQASDQGIAEVEKNAREHNPKAFLIRGASPIELDRSELVRGKRVLVVEDGPTTTHGGMSYGAGLIAAEREGAEIVDPRPFAKGEIAEAFEHYPHLEKVLPALGYGDEQVAELEATIRRVDCDAVVIGTPIDLSRVVRIDKPTARATYSYADAGDQKLEDVLKQRFSAMEKSQE